MEKPKRKKLLDYMGYENSKKPNYAADCNEMLGFNQACDEWEKFLPDVEEILIIIRKNSDASNHYYDPTEDNRIARAIAKRIGGER